MKRHNVFGSEAGRRGSIGVLATLLSILLTATVHAQTAFGSFPNNSIHSSASVMAAIANVPHQCRCRLRPIGQTNYLQVYNFGTLDYTGPVNVWLTLQRIRLGYWMPTETDDGGFFNFNNAGELPNIPRKGK